VKAARTVRREAARKRTHTRAPRRAAHPTRAAKDTGLANLPFHDADQNRIWVAISALAQDLLAWCARLALPTPAASYEPKRLRLRIFAVAGRLVRSARRHVPHIDPTWPWADTITTAHARLTALPAP
jgi:Transposase DDE domain group 1